MSSSTSSGTSGTTKADISKYTSSTYETKDKFSAATSGYKDYYKSKVEAAALAKQTGFNEKDYYPPEVIKDLYVHARLSYEKAGIPLTSTVYGKGPADLFSTNAGATVKDKLVAAAFDNLLYYGTLEGLDVSISFPDSKYWDISKIGQEMSSTQLLGAKNGIVLSGPRSFLEYAEEKIDISNGLDPIDGAFRNDSSTSALTIDPTKLQFNGQMLSGYILVDSGVSDEVYLDNLKHEMYHGGINVMAFAAKKFTNVVTNQETKRLLSTIKKYGQIANIINNGTGKDVQVGSIVLQSKMSNTDLDYVNSISEVLAYSNSGPLGKDELAVQFSLAYNIPVSEAKVALATIMNSSSLQDLNDDLEENAEFVMKKMDAVSNYVQNQCVKTGCGN